MQKLYYIAIQRYHEVEYIYRVSKPSIDDKIIYQGKQWTVVGYMEEQI